MSKNLYRVCKKSDLDEIIKNNFFKPICIIFTTKDTDKDFEDNIAGLFKTLAKQNTYCMHLLINLDNFIDNINFFGEMRLNSPNFITYFKGKQISSFSNTQNNKELFLSSTADIINKINSSYIQKLVNSFNEDNKTKQNNEDNYKKEDINENKNKKEEVNEEENEDLNEDVNEEVNEEEDDENEEEYEEGKEDVNENEEEEDEKENNEKENNEKEKLVNNIKKRNTDTVDKKEVNLNKVEKVVVSKVDLSKVDISKIDLSKIDLEQLSIDKKKEKLKELLELKKRAQKS